MTSQATLTTSAAKPMNSSLCLLALAAASFGIGTTEFVIMGLLPEVAKSFRATIPQAGYLVSGYAVGVVIRAPLVAMAASHLPRKAALLSLIFVFIIGNLACALAPSYGLLMAARILTSFAHGAFFGIGAVVARDIVPRERRARAVSMMFAGLTLANVLGVLLGQAAGWRSTFFVVTAIGIVAAAAIYLWVPSGLPGSRGSFASEFKALRRWAVIFPMLISTLASISLFSLFTYITPLLEDLTGLAPHGVAGALLAVGVGLTIGNFGGGRMADRDLLSTVIISFLGEICVLVLLSFLGRAFAPTLTLIILWGALSFALISPLQMWVVEAASDAANLVSTLNQGAFNLGNAIGAWTGGCALNFGMGYAWLRISVPRSQSSPLS